MRRVLALSPYARRTGRIGAAARRVRDAVVQAREPAQLLFDDLPAACGCPSIRAQPIGREQRERFTDSLRAALDEIERAYPALLDRTRGSIARELSLPEAPAELAAELRNRSRRIREITVDPSLAGFVLRAADEALDPDDLLISLRAQLADRPPHEWTDADEDRFDTRLADVARRFRNAEALRIVPDGGNGGLDGGPSLVRLSIARRGRPEHERVLPLRVADAPRIDALRERMLAALDEDAAAAGPDDALTALALAAESLMERAASVAADDDEHQDEGGGRE